MNATEAAAAGYKIERASGFEWGLLKNGRGCRTWYCADLGHTQPPLDHPLVKKAIEAQEWYEGERRTWEAKKK